MQASELGGAESGADLDYYLGNISGYPLLTPAQERETDLRKWAAVRSCQRLLVNNAAGRELLLELCNACLHDPPDVDTFESRWEYFQLRKDVGELHSGKPGAAYIADLKRQLEQGANVSALMNILDKAGWPATLVIGLATIELRALGTSFLDASADGLCAWVNRWTNRHRPADPRLASDLHHAVLRYLANRDLLVTHNIRLVYKLARQNQKRSVPLRDLVQEGSAGLMRAAEKFDYRLGYRFTTYAYNWINQFVQRACEGNGSLITYPAHVHQQVNHLHRLRMDYRERTGTDPGMEYLATSAGISEGKVRDLRRLNNLTVPLDQPVSDSSELTWANLLPDPEAEKADKAFEDACLNRLVDQRLGALNELEQQILSGRYGLSGGPAQTFRQLADQFNISSEWARQLEKSAIAKLREDRDLAIAYQEIEA
jgi:RNA polymerase primary sigma factor